MATSNTEIANIAISHLGIGKQIAALDTENSEEAKAVRVFYSIALDQMLRGFMWPFASRIVTLALVEEDPNDEWSFSYQYPSNCLNFRRILSGIRTDNRQSRIPYRIVDDPTGSLVYTDEEDAEAEYLVRVTDTLRFPPDFTMALSYLIASYCAPRLTGGDQFKLGEKALKMYVYHSSIAMAAAGNEEQGDELPQSEYIRAREGV